MFQQRLWYNAMAVLSGGVMDFSMCSDGTYETGPEERNGVEGYEMAGI